VGAEKWLCFRCTKKDDGTEWDFQDESVLRLCTSCKIENWVQPFGHGGKFRRKPSEEEIQEAHEEAVRTSKIGRERIKRIRAERIAAKEALASE
jgi:hypothetical protein